VFSGRRYAYEIPFDAAQDAVGRGIHGLSSCVSVLNPTLRRAAKVGVNFGNLRRQSSRKNRNFGCRGFADHFHQTASPEGRTGICRYCRQGGLNRSNKALRTPAFDALIDVMNEAGLVRFGAGKPHLGAAFTHRGFLSRPLVSLSDIVCRMVAPGDVALYGFTIRRVAATN